MEALRIFDSIANQMRKEVFIILNCTVLRSQSEGISTSAQRPLPEEVLSSFTEFPDVRAKAQTSRGREFHNFAYTLYFLGDYKRRQ